MFFKSCYADVFTFIIFSFIIRIKNLITYLFRKLIYEYKIICIISNSHVDVNLWHNRFSENENEAVEARIQWHRDSKTKKPWHWVPVEFWPLCPLIVLKHSGECRQIFRGMSPNITGNIIKDSAECLQRVGFQIQR